MPEYFPPPPDYDYVTTLRMYEVALLYSSLRNSPAPSWLGCNKLSMGQLHHCTAG